MWKRLRRRTMAPSRPALLPGQLWLVLVVALALLGSIGLVVWAFAQ
jgi:hypothetical protein